MSGQPLSLDSLLKRPGVEVHQHDFLATLDKTPKIYVVAVTGSEQAESRFRALIICGRWQSIEQQ